MQEQTVLILRWNPEAKTERNTKAMAELISTIYNKNGLEHVIAKRIPVDENVKGIEICNIVNGKIK